jgi:hypothetical protein
VRFLDVEFGKTTDVAVNLQQYPIVRHDVLGSPIRRDRIEVVDPPLWRRWYVVGPAAVGLAIVTAVVVGYAVHDFPSGDCRKLGDGPVILLQHRGELVQPLVAAAKFPSCTSHHVGQHAG